MVAIGGGHGLGRILASLSFLGPRLTGIVATTDNGGSTGRLRQDQQTIAWGIYVIVFLILHIDHR